MSKRKYECSFKKDFIEEFPLIIESRKGNTFAFCSACRCDFLIAHGGRRDIVKHIGTEKHKSSAGVIEKNNKLNFSFPNQNLEIVRSECFFTNFLLEHNIALSCADHAGALFRKMFPDSEIAKNTRVRGPKLQQSFMK